MALLTVAEVTEVDGEATAVPHEPVMVQRVTGLLAIEAGVLVDATVGGGGHAAALLEASGPDVHLIGFDRDPDALAVAARRLVGFGERAHLVHSAYDALAEEVTPLAEQLGPVAGVLYDLGVSSMQLDRGERGFSFRADGPLDMRMDPTGGSTAADLVNDADLDELTDVIRRYGEERYARRIARAILAARPLTGTRALADVVVAAVPAAARRGPIHPATRTFQALRIAVNDELARLSASLPQALELAAAPAAAGHERRPARGGRIAVLSYHSLEDRIVKRFFAEAARGCICPPDLPVCACGRTPAVTHLSRGAERPDDAEIARNPRSRAAKLRAVEKVA
jgi:16S rRNA (cytosine1402-N4)-methyltransferase